MCRLLVFVYVDLLLFIHKLKSDRIRSPCSQFTANTVKYKCHQCNNQTYDLKAVTRCSVGHTAVESSGSSTVRTVTSSQTTQANGRIIHHIISFPRRVFFFSNSVRFLPRLFSYGRVRPTRHLCHSSSLAALLRLLSVSLSLFHIDMLPLFRPLLLHLAQLPLCSGPPPYTHTFWSSHPDTQTRILCINAYMQKKHTKCTLTNIRNSIHILTDFCY